MDWVRAMCGATDGILKTHDDGKSPSASQLSIRLHVARFANEQHRRHIHDSRRCRYPWASNRLYLEYKRKD